MYRIFLKTVEGGKYGQNGVSYSNLAIVGSPDFDKIDEARAYIKDHSLPDYQFFIMECY